MSSLPTVVAEREKRSVSEIYGRVPLSFEDNRGQVDPKADFLARGAGYNLLLTASEAVLALSGTEQASSPRSDDVPFRRRGRADGEHRRSTVLRMQFVGANRHPRVTPSETLSTKINYLIGNDPARWHTGIPTYAKVTYANIYPNVDLLYYGTQRQLEYDFVVRPGASPAVIALRFEGADRLDVDAQGDLVLSTPLGSIRQKKPLIYQNIDGVRHEISGSYVLKGARHVGFQVASYDSSRTLIIDPVLFYSTFLGGSGLDEGYGIAVDAVGNAYVTGRTCSTDFPTTALAFQTTNAGNCDVFVTTLNPTGSAPVYSTYLGGTAEDFGLGIAVDTAGNAHVTGHTCSTDFPTTPGAFQMANAGTCDAFITTLDPTGSTLIYSTYLGGSNDDLGLGIALDAGGNAYVTGSSCSTDFPTTVGAFQTVLAGNCDAFLTKLNPIGSAALYSTYLGGSDFDSGQSVAVDIVGHAYAAGYTCSTDFPATAGAFQTSVAGNCDAFVTKMNPIGSSPSFSTYLGGSDFDANYDLALDAAGDAHLTGISCSTDFPTTIGAFQTGNAGNCDAFVTNLIATGSAAVYSTYLGGASNDEGAGIALDPAGNAHVTGTTCSVNFPATVGAFQGTNAGSCDAFVTKLPVTGTTLVYSTYLGGAADDFGAGIALDALPNPNAYVTGYTCSTNFPTTAGAFQTVNASGGCEDAFVSKITDVVLPPPPTAGKVTGGGSISASGGLGTFGFIVQRQAMDSSIHGHLQYVNRGSGAKVQSVTFTAFAVAGNTATFSGTCTNNKVPCSFTVNVTDNGEPGTLDTFTISVTPGTPEGGTLRGGNIQIHQ